MRTFEQEIEIVIEALDISRAEKRVLLMDIGNVMLQQGAYWTMNRKVRRQYHSILRRVIR